MALYSCSTDIEIENHYKALCKNNCMEFEVKTFLVDNLQNYNMILASLPAEITNNVVELPNDEIVKAIIKSKREMYFDFYSNAIESLYLQQKKNKSSVYFKLIQELYIANNLENTSISDTLIKIINEETKVIKFSTYREIYFTVKLLFHKAKILQNQNRIKESLAIYHMILFQIENSGKLNHLTYLKDITIQKILVLLSKQTDRKHNIQVSKYHISNLSSKYKESFDGKIIQYYTIDEETPNYLDSVFIYLNDAKGLVRTPMQNFILHYNLGYQFETVNRDSSLYHYNKTSELFSKSSCFYGKYYLLIYLEKFIQDSIKKIEVNEKLNEVYNCDPNIINRINYIKYQYIDPETFYSNIDTILSKYIDERNLAKKIFPGKSSLHLQDYYAKNCIKVMDVLIKQENQLEKEHLEMVVNLIYDTKINELYRNKHSNLAISNKNPSGNSENIYQKINNKLHEINDFNAIKKYSEPVYKELYNLYLLKGKQKESIDKTKFVSPELKIKAIQNKCKKDNALMLEFLVYKDYYYYYSISKESVVINKIKKHPIDSLIDLTNRRIIQKEDVSEQVGKLKSVFLGIIKNDSLKKIVVIPDGKTGQIPMNLVFDNDFYISQFNNVGNWLSSESIIINKNKALIASYSDKKSISNREKKVYSELPMAYEECNEIINILDLPKDKMISGNKLTRKMFSDINGLDLLHISTHASSNFLNRLDNYLVIRNKDGNADKLYSY